NQGSNCEMSPPMNVQAVGHWGPGKGHSRETGRMHAEDDGQPAATRRGTLVRSPFVGHVDDASPESQLADQWAERIAYQEASEKNRNIFVKITKHRTRDGRWQLLACVRLLDNLSRV